MTTKEIHIDNTFRTEQENLTGFVRSKVGSLEDAEDIVQDVFVSLTDGFDDISGLGKTIAWIYSVARHKVIDFLRKKKTYALEDQNSNKTDGDEMLSIADLLPANESLPDDQLMQDLIWEQVQAGLSELPTAQRKVFEWHELEGLSFQQISEITGETINTLISRKRYAVTYLRKQLQTLFEIINS